MTPSGGSEPARLERFDPVTTISALAQTERTNYDRALRTGDLAGGQQILQRSARRSATVPVAFVSDESARELGDALTNPERSGRFSTMVRSGGTPILPGSTLKGAFRTGLLHIETERLDPAARERVLAAIEVPGRSGFPGGPVRPRTGSRKRPFRGWRGRRSAIRCGMSAFPMPRSVQAQPSSIALWTGSAAPMFQLHVERCVCLADVGRYGDFAPPRVEIAVTGEAVRQRRSEVRDRNIAVPARSPHLGELIRGLNEHHLGVWHLERGHFFSGRCGRETTALLDTCLAALGLRDVEAIDGKPGWALLRLGWAGHFEAKSIAAVRQAFRPQSRDARTAKVGSTRRGAILGGVFVPFRLDAAHPGRRGAGDIAEGGGGCGAADGSRHRCQRRPTTRSDQRQLSRRSAFVPQGRSGAQQSRRNRHCCRRCQTRRHRDDRRIDGDLPLVVGERHGCYAAHHAEDRHEHRACLLEQHRAADHEHGETAERHQNYADPIALARPSAMQL
jgi:hypothetical protein